MGAMLIGVVSDTHGFYDPRVPPLLDDQQMGKVYFFSRAWKSSNVM